ncbi:MAG: SDR family NAD(P)-dependent oxidoreductase [Halobacteria archaeon]
MAVLDSFKLDGKSALVTGGGRGIGRAVALALAEAGADVAVCARTPKQVEAVAGEVRQRGRRSLPLACDVRKAADVEATVARTVQEFGQLDILVNNAGILFNNWLMDTTERTWHDVIDTNLTSAFLFCKFAGKHMIPRKSGSVVNMASAAGVAASPRQTAYHASKAGLILFTRSLALEWNRHNIRVNAICPGFIETDMTAMVHKNPKLRGEFVQRIPMRRLGRADEIGPLAVYLASDASSYVTGEFVLVDGGVTAY